MYNQQSSITNRKEISQAMISVYNWMSAGLCLTGFTAYYISTQQTMLKILFNPIMFIGLIIAEFALVMAISAGINKMHSSTATGLFLLYSILNGLTLSIIFLAYTSTSIATTFFVTAGMFGAMSFYGYVTKQDLSGFGKMFMMAIIGLIIASVVNLFLQNPILYWVVTYIGVIVFVGLTAYDTQQIKMMLARSYGGEQVAKIAIIGALKLYIDFINLFLFLLRIFGRR